MTETEIKFQLPPKGKSSLREKYLAEFGENIVKVAHQMTLIPSSRGWCYQLESMRLIDKPEFDYVQSLITECVKLGFIPIDLVSLDDARRFSGVETPESMSPSEYLQTWLEGALNAEKYYTPDWWKGERYYIQMIVEKVDLKTLFEPVCRRYHIPIATGKGWQSMPQRAEYANRFKRAEEIGLQGVLLYGEDLDVFGRLMSKKLRKNLSDLDKIQWRNGETGYDPKDLIIDPFCLTLQQVNTLNLTWIDNLKTGKKKPPNDLADPRHPQHKLAIVQDWLATIGPRKVEANALIVKPREAEQLCRIAIEKYLGKGALKRFQEKRNAIVREFKRFRRETGLEMAISKALDLIDKED